MSTTSDIRRENFDAIFASLTALRFAVWVALHKHGPGTTREIAAAARMDLLTLRPRVTELVQLGFAELAGKAGREGVYRARDYQEARQWHEQQQQRTAQLTLPLA